MRQSQGDRNTTLSARRRSAVAPFNPYAERKIRMTSFNIYRVRFIQSQRYAINISAPSAELAELFAEEIRKRAGAAPFEAIGEPFSDDWHSEEICPANAPDLLAAVQDALDQIRRGGPRWTIEEGSGSST
jgi:hypothetical protein